MKKMSDIANLPNIYGISVGHDFSNNFTKGFIERFKNCPPDYTTNITLYVNTNRMAENIKDSFLRLAPGFLPKIYSIADLRHLAIEHPLPDLLNPLEEQLELNELIK
jgi:ATP-dependent helicase/nuclease subunit B